LAIIAGAGAGARHDDAENEGDSQHQADDAGEAGGEDHCL